MQHCDAQVMNLREQVDSYTEAATMMIQKAETAIAVSACFQNTVFAQSESDAPKTSNQIVDALAKTEAGAARRIDALVQDLVAPDAAPQSDAPDERLKLVSPGVNALIDIAQNTASATGSLSQQSMHNTTPQCEFVCRHITELAQVSIDRCAKIMQMGAEACAKVEQVALENKQLLLESAFDGTLTIDLAKRSRIVECTDSVSDQIGMNMHGEYLSDVCTVKSRESLVEFLEGLRDSGQAAVVQNSTFADKNGFGFDVELRVVGEVVQNVALIGVRVCGDKREQLNYDWEEESTLTFALTKTTHGDDVDVTTQGTQTMMQTEHVSSQTDISWMRSDMRCLRCARPPTHMGAPSANASLQRPVAPGGRPRDRSPRNRRLSRPQSAPPGRQSQRGQLSALMSRTDSEANSPHENAGSGAVFDSQRLQGRWHVVSSPLPNSWLCTLEFRGDRVYYGDGNRARLERRADGMLTVAGGALFLDGNMLRREGNSGRAVIYEYVDDDDVSDALSQSSFS